jgi:hypothetical protein
LGYNKTWLSTLQEVQCSFPYLGYPPLLEQLESTRFLKKSLIVKWFDQQVKKLITDNPQPSKISRLFKRTGATSFSSRGSKCGGVIFGGFPGQPPAERELDTILHELGHWVDHSSRPALDIAVHPAPAFSEMVADLVAHIYLQTSCHIKRVDGSCVRQLNRKATSEDEKSYKNSYQFGQSSRYLAWKKFSSLPKNQAAREFIAARNAAVIHIPKIDPNLFLTITSLSRDEINSFMASEKKLLKEFEKYLH